MKLHLHSSATRLGERGTGRRISVLAASLALAVFLVATQAISQTRMTHDSADPAQWTMSGQQIVDAPFLQAETEISAPVPMAEEARLTGPVGLPFSSLGMAQNTGQSSSQSSQVQPPPAKTTATKPAHHALGMALAILGTATFALGVALYVGEQSISVCNGASHGCNETKDAGIAMMPAGGGLAVTGFYLAIHR